MEESAYSLSGSQHLGDLISCSQSEERKKVKSNIAGRYVAVIFDSTTTVCEAMVVIQCSPYNSNPLNKNFRLFRKKTWVPP